MNQTPAEYRIEELRAKIPMSFGEKLKRYQDELKNLESINSPSPVINTSGVSKPQDTAKDSTTGTQARSLPELDHQDHSGRQSGNFPGTKIGKKPKMKLSGKPGRVTHALENASG